MPLRESLATTWSHIQDELFPWLVEKVGPLTDGHRRAISVLEMARVEEFVQAAWRGPGRPPADRRALARAFTVKAVVNLPTTEALIERLAVDKTLRRLCGWEHAGQVPEAWTFSRAFAEFALQGLPGRVHEALITSVYKGQIVGHVSRDSTAIEVREKPAKVEKPRPEKPRPEKPERKRGRPRKGEVVAPKPPRRLEQQSAMTLAEMLADLPTHCDVGNKRNGQGRKASWIGYKLHIDTIDGDIPASCLLTSASVHDSQAAIPLATLTARRLSNLYDLMDSAYDAAEIKEKSRALGHVAIIAANPRRGGKAEAEAEARAKVHANYRLAEDVRYAQRSSAERVNGTLKDNFGGRHIRVRGAGKVFCHLMFGILAVTVEQLLRFVT